MVGPPPTLQDAAQRLGVAYYQPRTRWLLYRYGDYFGCATAPLRHSEELFALLSDTAYIHDSAQQAIWLAKASDMLDSAGSDPALQVQNLVAIGEIYVRWHEDGVDSLDSIQKAFIYYLAPRCPLVDGPGVYRARTLVAALGSVNSTI